MTRFNISTIVNKKCVAEGTQVALADGTSRAIEDLVDVSTLRANARIAAPRVSEDGTSPRLTETAATTAFANGVKNCVRLTLEDGRTLDVTPDHRLMTADGAWVEAKDLQVGTTRLAVSGIDYVADRPTVDEHTFVLQAGEYTLRMDTPTARVQTLAFARLLGFTLADGTISSSCNRSASRLGQVIDRDALRRDADLFDGSTFHESSNTWNVAFRVRLSAAFRHLDGVQTGRRIYGSFSLPVFLFEQQTPIALIREFLGGMFGGDGITIVADRNKNKLAHVALAMTSLERNVGDLERFMDDVKDLLSRCGVDVSTAYKQVYDSQETEGIYVAADGLKRKTVRLRLCNSLSFSECVGFRYCNQKAMRLSAANLWFRRRSKALEQRIFVFRRMLSKYDEENIVVDGKRKRVSGWNQIREEVINELIVVEPILISEMIPPPFAYSRNKVEHILRSATTNETSVQNCDKFAILRESRCAHWFDKGYIISRHDQTLPTIVLKVVDRRNIGERRVFDLSAPQFESFFANGIAVHNCMGK